MSFQTPTSGNELLWTRQEALCLESRASRPVLGCISHQECGWWAQAAPGLPSVPPRNSHVSPWIWQQLPLALLCTICQLGKLPGHSSCPFPTGTPAGAGSRLSPSILQLQPESCLCLPAFSGITWLGVSALCPVAGLAAEPGLQLAGKGREAAGSGL